MKNKITDLLRQQEEQNKVYNELIKTQYMKIVKCAIEMLEEKADEIFEIAYTIKDKDITVMPALNEKKFVVELRHKQLKSIISHRLDFVSYNEIIDSADLSRIIEDVIKIKLALDNLE